MDKVTIILEISQQEGVEPLSGADLVDTAVNILTGGGMVVHRSAGIGEAPQHPAIAAAIPAPPDEPAAPTIPYQSKATLSVSMGSQYLDVKGNDGNVLCSFEKPDVRRAWGELSRS